MSCECAPVVIFCYLRKDHLEKTLESLSLNELAKETSVFVYSDGAKNKEQEKKIKELRDYLKLYSKKSIFKNFCIKESNENKGLAKSIIFGVTEIIEKFGKVIVLEDDLISSSKFLTYMNDSLNKYENHKKIWSISGYVPELKIESEEKFFFIQRPWSWGWGTWKNRWELVDWNITNYKIFNKDKKMKDSFGKCGRDLIPMLQSQMEGRKYIDSWYVRFAYNQFINNGLTIYPIQSYIKNIGIDSSGTHSNSKNQKYWDIILNEKYEESFLPEEINESESISKIFFNKNKQIYYKGVLLKFFDDIGIYNIIRKVQKIIQK